MDRNSKGWLGTWGREEVGTQGKERPACTEKDTGEGWGEWGQRCYSLALSR